MPRAAVRGGDAAPRPRCRALNGPRGQRDRARRRRHDRGRRRAGHELCRRRAQGDAVGRQPLHQQGDARARNPLRRRSDVPSLSSPTRRAPPQRQTSLGSGVIVSSEGYVLTNHHVIARRRRHPARARPTAVASRRSVRGTRSGVRPRGAQDRRGTSLPAITLRRGRARCRSATCVLAIGNPVRPRQYRHLGHRERARAQLPRRQSLRGLHPDRRRDQSRQLGRRAHRCRRQPRRHQQHDLSRRSGGSLGIGFSIPVSLATHVFEQIVRDGEVTRGWLGIEPHARSPATSRKRSRCWRVPKAC